MGDKMILTNKINLYDEIINNWSIEAKKENLTYFYNINEVNLITSGKKSFVIGRKGSGKTSIAQYLQASTKDDVFCQMVPKWTSKEFGAEFFGVGFSYGGDYKESTATWLDAVEILEAVILNHCDFSNYYIIFDELDEDYKDFSNEDEAKKYKCMLTSLFKAVQDIRSTFDFVEKKIFPVVFLRSDIYSQLTDSDKNKWRESIIDLEWDTTRIKQMLAHRLCVAMDVEDEDFDIIWEMVFSKEKVKMGNNGNREMSIYNYIERSTEMRPRDFIQYIKECAAIAKEKQELFISPYTAKDADENFSEYLKGETIDELFAVLPEVDEILGLLSTIRKQSFRFDIFKTHYMDLVEEGKVPKRDVKRVLLYLFEAGVIGNAPTMRGQAIFSFSKKMPRFNFNEPMIIHRGLYKALQIF